MVTRRAFSTALLTGIATSVVGISAPARATQLASRNVVLIHGLYADGSSWSDVIPRLQAAGMRATAVQTTLRSFADDVALTRLVLGMQDGPTVLVAHSFGGMILSETGVHPSVSSLVYVAARAPDAGENYAGLAARFPKPPASAGLVTTDGFQQLNRDAFLNDFANGVDPAKARLLYAVQAQNAATLPATAKTTVAAWRSKPSWYAVSKQDRTINPNLERFMAARMKATTIEVNAGHLSLISHPREIAGLILAAAGGQATI
ncbi:MAG TPA: alpha/beta hydrolase [Candidatus Cybelea sp.]|nr:alpha/beta hydrolase [Candidatus Cybelea sp.]